LSVPQSIAPRVASDSSPPGDAPESPFRTKLVWIGVLYFASGFPYGLVNELLPTYLRTSGVDVARIGHTVANVGLPWALKFAWAPLVDRMGTRKAWIIACQLLIGVIAFSLVGHDGAALTTGITLALFALAVLSATQDIAADAYSIELLEERERGPANSARTTLYRLALIVSGGGLVSLSGYVGWRPVFGVAGVIMVLLALFTTRVPGTRRSEGRANEPIWEPLRELFGRPHAWAIVLFPLLFRLGDYALITMIKPFWVDSHYSTKEIGAIQGTAGIALTIVGAIVGGLLIPRLGTFRALIVLGIAQAAGSLTYWLVALAGAPRPAMWTASVVEHFTFGLATTAFMTYLMSVCERRYAATQFALLTALFGAGRYAAQYFSGNGVEALGYPNFFLATFFLAIPAWLLLPVVRKTLERPS
jgi:PAT family beta-lactamase induction signal transducer AmpG